MSSTQPATQAGTAAAPLRPDAAHMSKDDLVQLVQQYERQRLSLQSQVDSLQAQAGNRANSPGGNKAAPFLSGGGNRQSTEAGTNDDPGRLSAHHNANQQNGLRSSLQQMSVDDPDDLDLNLNPSPEQELRESKTEMEEEGDLHKFWPRVSWLLALLFIQSISSFILKDYDDLLKEHRSIMYFLTMLVGAGGNAGGQSAVLAVRSIALTRGKSRTRRETRRSRSRSRSRGGSPLAASRGSGPEPSAPPLEAVGEGVVRNRGGNSKENPNNNTLTDMSNFAEAAGEAESAENPGEDTQKAQSSLAAFNANQVASGFFLAVFLAGATVLRTTLLQRTSWQTSVALSSAMFFIVYVAVLCGTFLPQVFLKVGIDPAHASATIQVSMDIIGILVTCMVTSFVFWLLKSKGLMGSESAIDVVGGVGDLGAGGEDLTFSGGAGTGHGQHLHRHFAGGLPHDQLAARVAAQAASASNTDPRLDTSGLSAAASTAAAAMLPAAQLPMSSVWGEGARFSWHGWLPDFLGFGEGSRSSAASTSYSNSNSAAGGNNGFMSGSGGEQNPSFYDEQDDVEENETQDSTQDADRVPLDRETARRGAGGELHGGGLHKQAQAGSGSGQQTIRSHRAPPGGGGSAPGLPSTARGQLRHGNGDSGQPEQGHL